MALAFPQINGKAVDYSRIELKTDGKTRTAFESIAYSQPLEEGIIFGTAAEPLGRTRGQLQIGEGTLEFSNFEEAEAFITDLGEGYLENEFTITVTYARNPGEPFIVHELLGCRLLDIEDDHTQGSDALSESMPFTFLKMTRNGVTALINQR